MLYSSEHICPPALHQMQCGVSVPPVLAHACRLDIAINPVPNALFEVLTADFII